jgi:hypothetical protein
MKEKRQPTVRTVIERGRKQLNALGMMLFGMLEFISSALGVIVGVLAVASLAGAIGVMAYLTFKRW